MNTEYQQQRTQYRAQSAYDYLRPRDPVRANVLWHEHQKFEALKGQYRDHEFPMKEDSNMHTPEFTLPVEFNNVSTPIWKTFASTSGNLEIIRTACHHLEQWSKVGEGFMYNERTGNNVRWIEIQSPKGEVFRVTFDKHPEHHTYTPSVWMKREGKLCKINLHSGKMGAARRYLLENFSHARPTSPYFSLHGAHYIVVMALLLDGQKLNVVSKRIDIAYKILSA